MDQKVEDNVDLGKRGASQVTGSPTRWRFCKKVGKHAPSSSDCLRIGTWNVRSLLNPGKISGVIQEMLHMNLDVLGIAKTHWKDAGEFVTEIPTSHEKFRVIYSGGSKSRNGTAIVLNEESAKTLMYYDTYSERIMLVKLKGNKHDTVIIQTYAPTTVADESEGDQFYEQLTEVIKSNCKSRDKFFVGGDFNAIVGNICHEKIVGPFGLGLRNERGDRLIEFAQQHHMLITNTWYEQRERCRHTWTAPNGITKNQIDYILVSNRYRNSVSNAKARHDVDCGSDHDPVIIASNTRLKKVSRNTNLKNGILKGYQKKAINSEG
ncbi:craniofacial development protein 2-like [Anneissia japonica]|uniref:craniofacial development protein 2-like n=1 Tax=Anneissia japonica TaxID=1529436 RepID=UPI0014258A4F|nr:craniofacial development protein 2-like [Anneissia japonica]